MSAGRRPLRVTRPSMNDLAKLSFWDGNSSSISSSVHLEDLHDRIVPRPPGLFPVTLSWYFLERSNRFEIRYLYVPATAQHLPLRCL